MQKKNLSKLTITAIATTFMLFLTGHPVNAQSTGLLMSPQKFEITANRGDSIVNSIKITNISDKPIQLVTDTYNFTASGEEGSVALTGDDTSFSLAKWISVTPARSTIPAGETQVFNFIIDVPLNAEPGGKFGAISFRTDVAPVEDQSGASVSQEIASLVLLSVAGDVTEEASLVSFDAAKDFYQYGPVDFEVRVANEGNVHVKPEGKITVTNMFGKKVETVVLEPKNVLPGSTRLLSGSLNKEKLLGNYTASLVLTFGNNKTVVGSANFFAFPVKEGTVVILVTLLVLAVLVKGRKRLSMAMKVLFGGK